MRIFFFFLYLFAGMTISQKLKGQVRYNGKIIDSLTKKAIIGVNIRIYDDKDSVTRQTTISNDKGEFNFFYKKNRLIKMSFQHISYKKTSVKNIEINGQNKFILVELVPKVEKLDSIEIVSRKDFLIIKGDTLEYSPIVQKYRKDANAEELITQLPGFRIEDEIVTVNGQVIYQINVDGRPFFTSNPMKLLKVIPAEAINKVQVINSRSEQESILGYNSGERKKEINIILKENKRKGFFGNQLIGFGNSKTYNVDADINLFKEARRYSILYNRNNINNQSINQYSSVSNNLSDGINRSDHLAINLNNKITKNINIDIEGAYKTNKLTLQKQSTTRYLDPVSLGNLRDISAVESTDNKSFLFNFLIKNEATSISKHKFLFNPVVEYASHNRNSNTNLIFSQQKSVENITKSNIVGNGNNLRLTGKALYSYTFGKRKNSIGFSITKGEYRTDDVALPLAYNISSINFSTPDTIRQAYKQVSSNQISRSEMKFVYTHPIERGVNLEFLYTKSESKNNSETYFYNLNDSGNIQQLDTGFSNNIKYFQQGNIVSIGLNYEKKHFKFSSNCNILYQNVKNIDILKEKQFDILFNSLNPRIIGSYSLNDVNVLTFSYQQQNTLPTANQLQSAPRILKQFDVYFGNEDLNQEYNHILNLNLSSMNRETGSNLQLTMDANIIENNIIESYKTLTRDSIISQVEIPVGSFITTPINFGTRKSWGLRLYGMTPIGKSRWNIINNITFRSSTIPTLREDLTLHIDLESFSGSISIESKATVLKNQFRYQIDKDWSKISQSNKTFITTRQFFSYDATYPINYSTNLTSHLQYKFVGGLNDRNTNFWIWNLTFQTAVFKKLKLFVTSFDLLNQNKNERRISNANFYQTEVSNSIGRYIMFSLKYTFRKFGM